MSAAPQKVQVFQVFGLGAPAKGTSAPKRRDRRRSSRVTATATTRTGRRLEDRLPRGATVWVPEHYFVEVAAVLRRSELHDRFPAPRIHVALARLVAAPLNRVSVAPLRREAWSLRHNLTVADALYVVVASHLEAALVTTDLRLAAAPAPQVETITP